LTISLVAVLCLAVIALIGAGIIVLPTAPSAAFQEAFLDRWWLAVLLGLAFGVGVAWFERWWLRRNREAFLLSALLSVRERWRRRQDFWRLPGAKFFLVSYVALILLCFLIRVAPFTTLLAVCAPFAYCGGEVRRFREAVNELRSRQASAAV